MRQCLPPERIKSIGKECAHPNNSTRWQSKQFPRHYSIHSFYMRLLCSFWYDGPHLARRMTYLSLVFDGESPLPKGHFIEDTFGKVLQPCVSIVSF